MGTPDNPFTDVLCPGADPEADETTLRARFGAPDDGEIRVLAFDPSQAAVDAYNRLNTSQPVTVADADHSTPLNCTRFEDGNCRTVLPDGSIDRPIQVVAVEPEGGFPVQYTLEIVSDRKCVVAERVAALLAGQD